LQDDASQNSGGVVFIIIESGASRVNHWYSAGILIILYPLG
tara:strand:+ start:735 stop:857 length:123 start_codon:yes stop_codon:yes gene_type:complete